MWYERISIFIWKNDVVNLWCSYVSSILKFSWKKLISRKIIVWYICISKKRRTPSSLKFIWDRSCCYVLYTIMVVVLVNFNHSNSSCDFLTHLATLRLNSGKFSRHSLAASTFAGDLRRAQNEVNISLEYLTGFLLSKSFLFRGRLSVLQTGTWLSMSGV